MLELAKQLALFDQKYFSGWIIAGLDVHVHGKCKRFEMERLSEKVRSCVLEVRGYSDVQQYKSLRVTLVLPKGGAHAAARAEAPEGSPLTGHVFTQQDIADYVAYVGDENVIHKGEHAIVPGLCLLAWLQQDLMLSSLDWQVRFLAPVYAGDRVDFYLAPKLCRAFAGSQPVFEIKM